MYVGFSYRLSKEFPFIHDNFALFLLILLALKGYLDNYLVSRKLLMGSIQQGAYSISITYFLLMLGYGRHQLFHSQLGVLRRRTLRQTWLTWIGLSSSMSS